ncbi:Uma2 family endonuclease [Humisphaera borealis]|uniref:Uma2 family endonuclease n=1 Tax=Humisphaera borealis TaxID=2807512 RepID=A0A7M2X158_9BACT|nr:Uma2 family endonuclease [Humisphaera borealis]QOV90470.1 Uma2 family endonuclease [Humisphaera borealis]
MKLLEPRIKRWTRDEYYQMADLGWFRGKRALLLSGEIYEMAGQGNWHSVAISLVDIALRPVFTVDKYWIRPQMPLDLEDGTSEPEPDIAVVLGTPNDYSQHPSTARLIVEIADSSLYLDRRKAAYYAAADVPEYWILNLRERALEVHRTPQWNSTSHWDRDTPPDASYTDRQILSPDDVISPVAMPTATIVLNELFPARPKGDTF